MINPIKAFEFYWKTNTKQSKAMTGKLSDALNKWGNHNHDIVEPVYNFRKLKRNSKQNEIAEVDKTYQHYKQIQIKTEGKNLHLQYLHIPARWQTA